MKKIIEYFKNLFVRYNYGLIDETDPRDFGADIIAGEITRADLTDKEFSNMMPILVNQLDTDFCFPRGTKVLCEDFKYRNIEDLSAGEVIYTHKGVKKRILDTSRRKWQGTMVKIKVWKDYREIITTPEHQFLVYDKGVLEFKAAKDLKTNDYLVIPRIKYCKDTSIYDFEKDKDFLWVVGLYLAEGNKNSDKRIQFSLGYNEKSFAEKIKKTMSKYGANVYTVFAKKYNRCVVYITGEKWVNVFVELCGEYCETKRIADRLMLIDPKLQQSIVDGFIDGDGHIKKKTGETIMVSTSLQLLLQLRNILIRNGLLASINKRKDVEGKLPVWTLSYFKNPASYFSDENNIYIKIRDIEHKEKQYSNGYVYNLKVEDDESYIVNNYAVHNCVGCSRAYGAQATEKKLMSWAGAFALGARAMGYIPKWGISILQVCKGAVKYGTPELKYWEYKRFNGLPKTGRNYFANWKNMSQEALDNAAKHKAESFFRIREPRGWDRFDTFRAYLNKFRDKKVVIHTGVDAHAITLIGQKKRYGKLCLFGPDSYGRTNKNYRLGKSVKGFRYFTRQEVNQLFSGYIVFDLPRKLAEILQEYSGKVVKLKDSLDCYLIEGGRKHFIPDEKTAWSHGFLLAPYDGGKLVEIIDKEDFDKIPNGDPLKFEGGKNEWIVRRIAELYKIKL